MADVNPYAIGRRFIVATRGRLRPIEWEIESEPLQDLTGEQFVWVHGVRRLWGAGHLPGKTPCLLRLIPPRT